MSKILPKKVEIIGRVDGQRATLISTGLLRCECMECLRGAKKDARGEPTIGVFFTPSDMVTYCPTCGGRDIRKAWTRPMTALVPEAETDDFMVYTPEP